MRIQILTDYFVYLESQKPIFNFGFGTEIYIDTFYCNQNTYKFQFNKNINYYNIAMYLLKYSIYQNKKFYKTLCLSCFLDNRFNTLNFIPKPLRSYEFCLESIKMNPFTIEFVPIKTKNYYSLVKIAFQGMKKYLDNPLFSLKQYGVPDNYILKIKIDFSL